MGLGVWLLWCGCSGGTPEIVYDTTVSKGGGTCRQIDGMNRDGSGARAVFSSRAAGAFDDGTGCTHDYHSPEPCGDGPYILHRRFADMYDGYEARTLADDFFHLHDDGGMDPVACSPDGARVVGMGWDDLELITIDGSASTTVLEDCARGTFSPDSTELLLRCHIDGEDATIFRLPATGGSGGLTPVGHSEVMPIFTADSSQLLATDVDGAGVGTVSLMNLDGSNAEVLGSVPGGHIIHRLQMMPGADQVLIQTSRQDADWSLLLMDGSTGEVEIAVEDEAGLSEFGLSPDGTAVVFERDADVFVIGLDGSAPINLTDSDVAERHPRFLWLD